MVEDRLDELRRVEFARLDAAGHVYLDYTGAGLYADSQLREHFELLHGGVFGNPHSLNPASAASTELLERAQERVLRFFRASPEEYVAIFTPNATGALRLVGEAYPFRPGDRFLLTFDIAAKRSRSSSARGSQAGRSSPRSSSASTTSQLQAQRTSKTAQSTTSTSRRWRSG